MQLYKSYLFDVYLRFTQYCRCISMIVARSIKSLVKNHLSF